MEPKQSISHISSLLKAPFQHLTLGCVDDYCAYLTRMEGAYLYHQHEKDEMYLVLEGEIAIDYADGTTVPLGPGESLVVRAGERHRSRSESGALVLMFKSRDMFAQ
ncbi:MAG: cupin domain-containing protein [Anaerolineae bacterium]